MSIIDSKVALYDNLGLTRANEPKPEPSKQDQFMQLLIAQLKNMLIYQKMLKYI